MKIETLCQDFVNGAELLEVMSSYIDVESFLKLELIQLLIGFLCMCDFTIFFLENNSYFFNLPFFKKFVKPHEDKNSNATKKMILPQCVHSSFLTSIRACHEMID